MADYRYSFQDVKCIYQPQWMAPEGLCLMINLLKCLHVNWGQRSL